MKKGKNRKIKNWVEKNFKITIGVCCGILVGIVLMLFLWPERIAQNKNGEDIILSFDGKKYSVTDFYNNMLNFYNASILVNMIDKDILSSKYSLTEAEEATIKEQAVSYISYYQESYGYTEEEFLTSNGFNSYDEFIEYLKLDSLRNKYLEEYVKSLVKEEDIKEYYEQNVYGKYTTHYISVASNDSSKDDETLIAKILKEVKEGSSYETIKEKYSKSIKSGELIISWDDVTTDEKYVSAAKKIKAGKYSSNYITTTTYGHCIIWVDSIDKIPTLDSERENIILTLSMQLGQDDQKLIYKALIDLRDDYNLKIYDTNINQKYELYKKSFK